MTENDAKLTNFHIQSPSHPKSTMTQNDDEIPIDVVPFPCLHNSRAPSLNRASIHLLVLSTPSKINHLYRKAPCDFKMIEGNTFFNLITKHFEMILYVLPIKLTGVRYLICFVPFLSRDQGYESGVTPIIYKSPYVETLDKLH